MFSIVLTIRAQVVDSSSPKSTNDGCGMATPAPNLMLLTEAVVVQLPHENSVSEQPKEEVCSEYRIQCVKVHPDETQVIMPNYIELV